MKLILVFLITSSAVFSYYPGKWNYVDTFVSSNSLFKPKGIETSNIKGIKIASTIKYDKSGRITVESFYYGDDYSGKTTYEYGKNLKKIIHYNLNDKIIDTIEYKFASNCLRQLTVKEKGTRTQAVMKIICTRGKISNAKVYNGRKSLISNMIFNYTKGVLTNIYYYVAGVSKAKKIVRFHYKDGFLIGRTKEENNSILRNELVYKNKKLSLIKYYDENNSLKRELKLKY